MVLSVVVLMVLMVGADRVVLGGCGGCSEILSEWILEPNGFANGSAMVVCQWSLDSVNGL